MILRLEAQSLKVQFWWPWMLALLGQPKLGVGLKMWGHAHHLQKTPLQSWRPHEHWWGRNCLHPQSIPGLDPVPPWSWAGLSSFSWIWCHIQPQLPWQSVFSYWCSPAFSAHVGLLPLHPFSSSTSPGSFSPPSKVLSCVYPCARSLQ